MPQTTVIQNPNQTESLLPPRSIAAKKKYKVLLTKHNLSPYSLMLMSMQKEKDGNFVADISFSSSSSSDTSRDIESIKESELADVIGKHHFRVFRIKSKSSFVMEITINGEQKGRQEQQHNHGNFVADISFSSSSSSDTSRDIESIKESDLADVIKRYSVFVGCIKTSEQKELSRRSKNAFEKINLRSIIQHVSQGMNVSYMKKQ